MYTVNDFIESADLARQENSLGSISITMVENLGKVICYRDYGVYKRGRPSVARSNFKLNGKVISAANLEKLLSK